jgi:imidazolonepropionase
MSVLITNIGELITNTPADDSAPTALVLDGGRVAWTGPAASAPAADEAVDAGGRAVLPGFVDSHAHLVFAGERGAEFAARMAGRPYAAGGIRSTVAATRAASDAQLRANLGRLAAELLAQGTTTFECKSGYGLTVADEARSVALAAEVTPEVTYLGAHVVPPEFDGDAAGYVDLVCGAMLTACAPHARWVDVFCERGAFGADEARAVLAAGASRSRWPRAPRRPTTAPTPTTPTWPRWPAATRWRRCCPALSSPPGSPTRTPGGCSTRASPWPSPPTATPAPASPPACRCASRSRSGRCG